MCKKNKLSNIIIWSLVVFLLVFVCLLVCFKEKNNINFKYKDNVQFELKDKVSLCVKKNDLYVMCDYYIDKKNKYLNIISLYLGAKKYISTDEFIPSNMVLSINKIEIDNNKLFIYTSDDISYVSTEAFKMMKITFKELGINEIKIGLNNMIAI